MSVQKSAPPKPAVPAQVPQDSSIPPKPGWLLSAWEGISRLGLAEYAFRLGTHVLLVTSILIVAWVLRAFYSLAQEEPDGRIHLALELSLPTPTYSFQSAQMPLFDPEMVEIRGLSRQASLHTDLPSRPRFEVLQYTVQDGETLVAVAGKFGLQPETILWANQDLLQDNPHNFHAGQTLTILPVDGTYHRWSAGDNLETVARFYHTSSEAILSYPGNHLRPSEVGELTNPAFVAGTLLVIPGGSRDFVTWKIPQIPRQDPAVGKILGTGACESIGDGPIGSGELIWPTDAHYLAGYDFLPNSNHFGIDIAAESDFSAFAADSGVVVYAGWNEWGYGNIVVVNHGNDWQTLYANLSGLYVVCGQTIWQGGVVGIIAEDSNHTTTTAGLPYLHFEMMYKGTLVNPHDYLP